jgi:hypothetical protein
MLSSYQPENLPWGEGVEGLLQTWCAACNKCAVLHDKCASKKKRRFHIISVPSIIIPIAMASFSQLYSVCNDYEAQLANSIGYLISGSLAGLGAFFNYGTQYAQHAQYEMLYKELGTEMECILSKPVNFRGHADVVLAKMRLKLDALNKASPDL